MADVEYVLFLDPSIPDYVAEATAAQLVGVDGMIITGDLDGNFIDEIFDFASEWFLF